MFPGPLPEEGGAFALVVDPYWILVAIVQFGVLFFLLQRLLWRPILTALQMRADKISEGLAAAEAAKRERERMKEEVERLLAEARREAAALAERSTTAAEAAAAGIRDEAKAEAERIRERARRDAEQFHRQALAQLRGEVAALVVLAAGRILGREVDGSAHRALIERSLDQAGSELGRLS